MTEIASLRVGIGMDAAGFHTGAQQVSKATDTLGDRLKRLAQGHDKLLMAQERAGGAMSAIAAKAQASVAGFAGISETMNRASESARAFQQSLDARGRIDALAASMDPMVAATQRYEAASST